MRVLLTDKSDKTKESCKPHGPNKEETWPPNNKLNTASGWTPPCECSLPFWRWWYRSAGWQLAQTWLMWPQKKSSSNTLFFLLLHSVRKSPLDTCQSEASVQVGGLVEVLEPPAPHLSADSHTFDPNPNQSLCTRVWRDDKKRALETYLLTPAASLSALHPSISSTVDWLSLFDFSQPLDLPHWLRSLVGVYQSL